MTDSPVAVLVTFHIAPTREPEFLAVLLPHLRRVAAEKTCRTMRVNRSRERAGEFMLYEEWDDRDEFLEVQMNRPYRFPYNAALEGLEDAERGVSLWDLVPLEDQA